MHWACNSEVLLFFGQVHVCRVPNEATASLAAARAKCAAEEHICLLGERRIHSRSRAVQSDELSLTERDWIWRLWPQKFLHAKATNANFAKNHTSSHPPFFLFFSGHDNASDFPDAGGALLFSPSEN